MISTGSRSDGDFEEIDVMSEKVIVKGRVVEVICSNVFSYDTSYNVQISPGSFRSFYDQKNNNGSVDNKTIIQEYFDGILTEDIFKFKTQKKDEGFVWGDWKDWGECSSITLKQKRSRSCKVGSCVGKDVETRDCIVAFETNIKNDLSSITRDSNNKKLYNIDLLILYTPDVIRNDELHRIKGIAAVANLRVFLVIHK